MYLRMHLNPCRGGIVRGAEEYTVVGAIVILFVEFIASLYGGKPDQKIATLSGLLSMFVPALVRRIYPVPSKRVWPWVSPFYDDGIYALFAVFMVAHVTFLEVPFLYIDLYNDVWQHADMPSHYLGGLVVWVVFNKVVLEASRTYNLLWSGRRIIGTSFLALLLVGLSWEVFEVLLQPGMPWLHESLENKVQDIVMEILGFATGILMVCWLEYPYSMKRNSRDEKAGWFMKGEGVQSPPHYPKEVE